MMQSLYSNTAKLSKLLNALDNFSRSDSQLVETTLIERSYTTLELNEITTIGHYAFWSCCSLTEVSFPNCSYIGISAFHSCTSLTKVSLPNCTTIGDGAFARCSNLIAFYLTGSSLCSLVASNAFSSTPIGGYPTSSGIRGNIYVLSSLVSAYKSASNWSYFSSRIFAYTE